MRTPKKRMIFSSDARTFDECKEFLMEDSDRISPPTDDEVWQQVADQTQFDWEDAEYELKRHLGKFDRFLVVGSCGTWQGPRAGGKFCKDLREIMGCMKNCDSYYLYDENGRLHIEGWHHDGHNSFEVKALTGRGLAMAYHAGFENYRELHEKLWNSNLFTKDLHFAHEVYGCPKRAYEKEKRGECHESEVRRVEIPAAGVP